MAASILCGGQDVDILVHQHRSANGYFFQNNMSFSRAIFPPKVLPTFFGHSLLSYSKRRHLSTTRVIPRPLSYHPYHMMTSYDTASICQSMLVENDVRMGVLFSGNKELSKSYREGTAQKLKSMALPYKTKVLKKS